MAEVPLYMGFSMSCLDISTARCLSSKRQGKGAADLLKPGIRICYSIITVVFYLSKQSLSLLRFKDRDIDPNSQLEKSLRNCDYF